jgi:tyrosinase
MTSISNRRRAFVQGTASALALASLPRWSMAATVTNLRLEWQAFKVTPHYASLLNAIRTMQAVTDASKPTSWQYWVNVHLNYCPHETGYFLTWHRGYLYYFERQLRTVSGDATLTLPYWDYYTYPTIPSEFTDTASGNPLYTTRVNNDVYTALSMTPFGTGVKNFQRGLNNAFEAALEDAPHNPVHDTIGGYMSDIATAPIDPIFYLHHCNIDRLWNAWSLRSTAKVPATNSAYWNGSFTYASGLTMNKVKTRTALGLGYDYANDRTPASLPPEAQEGRIIRVQAQVAPIMSLPPLGTFAASTGGSMSSSRRPLGGLKGIMLGERSISGRIALQSSNATLLKDTLQSSPAAAPDIDQSSEAEVPQSTMQAKKGFNYVKLVLDNVALLPGAANGGFFYNLYVNLPSTGDVDAAKTDCFIGTLGAFQISTMRHHGMKMLEYDITHKLARLGISNPNDVTISFVRVSPKNAPKGNAVSVGEMRVELGTDAP